jgi:hypothetical protein
MKHGIKLELRDVRYLAATWGTEVGGASTILGGLIGDRG